MLYVDLWRHIIHDSSLLGKDGVQWNRSGNSRLGKVMDEAKRRALNNMDGIAGAQNPGLADSRHLADRSRQGIRRV